MASIQGWGRQTWNSGAWDTFAPVNATGNGLSSSVGTVSLVTTNVFGVTGNQITSTIGEASQASEYAATGNALTSTTGTMPNPTIVDNQKLTGWNRGVGTILPLGWSTSSWGNGDFVLTADNGLSGVGLTSSLGEEVPTGNADVTATAAGLTSTTGTAVATGIAEVTATGNPLTSTLGTEIATGDSNVTATGNALTSALGEEDASGVFQSGWGRGANQVTGEIIGWSDNLWNILETEYAFTGVSATTSSGDLGFRGDVAPTITGVELTSAATTPGTSVFVTGVSATSTIGTFSISGDNNLTIVVTEDGLVSRAGTLPITIDASPQLITSSLGSSTITGDSNVTLTGNATTVSLGDEEASGSAPVDVTGIDLAADTNDVVATGGATVAVTAAGLTSTIGDAGQETSYEAPSVSMTSEVTSVSIRTDVAFTITGVSATSSVGNLGGTFWSQVDDSNPAIVWTEVHKAA